MENYSFKSVAFGGFDKQDVVRYLEQASEKAAALQRELEAENAELRKQVEDRREELDQLRARVEELTAQRDGLQEKLESEAAARANLEPLRALEQDVARLKAERDALKPDAEAYALEEEAAAQTRRTLEEFRSRYSKLMSDFEAASGHVNGELRKIEVTLSQLPRALDQTGAQLNELAARLEKKPEGKPEEKG